MHLAVPSLLVRRSIMLLVSVALVAMTLIGLAGMSASIVVVDRSRDSVQAIDVASSLRGHTQRIANLIAIDALKGQDKFAGKPIPVRTLAVLYPNRMHVVSIEGSGITKMADMKGKRVSTGSGGSATEVFAFRVIEAAGLDKDKDMRR